MTDLDVQPTLDGPTLHLRPLVEADREDLMAAASDPLIWEVHPAHTRHERATFDPYFTTLASTGGALAVIDRALERIIGTSSFYVAPDPAGALSIGYTFLERAYWGGETNFELKRLMIEHLFQWTDTVWLHVDTENIRSQRATLKLGTTYDGLRDMDFGTGSGSAPRCCYHLTKAAWARTLANRANLPT